jgi:hypothetical protein
LSHFGDSFPQEWLLLPFWDDCIELFEKTSLYVIECATFSVETWSRSSVVAAGGLGKKKSHVSAGSITG